MPRLVSVAKYVIDTSALIDMNRLYPSDRFPSLWAEVETLVASGVIIAPREVRQEIDRGDDALLPWVKARGPMFIDCAAEYASRVKAVLRDFPHLVNPSNPGPQADPYVVALAVEEQCAVISHEGRGSKQHPKIPDACRKYGVRHLGLLDLVRESDWSF